MAEPVFEPLTPMSRWIGIAEHRFHPHLAARPDLDRASRHVICPQIECAAARQFEPRMMPVAGQDAVLDAAPIERETHMRAAIVEREDMPALVYEEDRAMAAVHNKSALGFQLLKGAAAHKLRGRVIHRRLSPDNCPQPRDS